MMMVFPSRYREAEDVDQDLIQRTWWLKNKSYLEALINYNFIPVVEDGAAAATMDFVLIAILVSAFLAPGFVVLDRRNARALLVLLAVTLLLTYLVVGRGMDIIYQENNWLENLQVAVLLISCLVFALAGLTLRSRDRALALFLAILCFIFSFREVDVDELRVPGWLIFLLAEEGRAVFFVVALIPLLRLLRSLRHYRDHWAHYMRASLGVYLLKAAFLLIVLSSAFEKNIFGDSYHVFAEELAEFVAYCLMLLASLDLVRALGRVAQEVSARA